MKSKELVFLLAFVSILGIAIFASSLSMPEPEKSSTSVDATGSPEKSLIQLNEEGRENAATMVLLGAPPMQPASHIDRWKPELRQESCMACHGNKSTGAPTPPDNHFYKEDIKNKVFRDNCVQCHAQQNDTKAAFNEK